MRLVKPIVGEEVPLAREPSIGMLHDAGLRSCRIAVPQLVLTHPYCDENRLFPS